jgi:hypothetical protein
VVQWTCSVAEDAESESEFIANMRRVLQYVQGRVCVCIIILGVMVVLRCR